MQTEDVTLVGSMGRSGIAEGTGMFQRGIQQSGMMSQVKALVDGGLLGMLCQASFDDKG